MKFTEKKIKELRQRVSLRMSEKRFRHTLGVEEAAVRIAAKLLPERIDEIRCAALLHDVSKELSVEEQLSIMKSLAEPPTESDYMSQSLYHSITAPTVAMRDFSEFVTEDILSALKNHTSGSPDMTLFDEIIFIADFIDEGRTYEYCRNTREAFYARFDKATDREELIQILHETTVQVLNFTIVYLVNNTMYLNERTVATRNAFLGRLPVPLKKEY